MKRVVEDDASEKLQREDGWLASKPDEHSSSAREQQRAQQPDSLAGNCARRNGALAPVLPVERRVEGVVEEHPADIDQRRARAQPRETVPLAAAAKQPTGETVGPNGGQIRDAAQH